jgi:hypothetical protein
LAVAAALVLAGCAKAEDIATEDAPASASPTTASSPTGEPTQTPPSQTTPAETETTPTETPTESTPTQTQPDLAPRPVVGNCYEVSRPAFKRQKDGSFPVRCRARHTAETYLVRSVAPYPSAAQIDEVWRSCHDRFRGYVGASATVSNLGIALITPSAQQVRAGHGWVRCDVIERSSFNGEIGLPRTGSVRDILANGVPDRYRACSKRWPKVVFKVRLTSCDEYHQAELIPQSVRIGGPSAPYPGRNAARNRSATFCEDIVLDYVPEARRYYYYYPTRGSWRAGTRDTVCWALDTTGDGLPPI